MSHDFDGKRPGSRGTAVPLRGNDIDTDQIIPARYLKQLTFEGLGEHLFADARLQDAKHVFNQPRFDGASVLVVGRNFGCGSSREHAPRALYDWGIRAVVGISFAEIFFGNSTAIGLPCVTAAPETIEDLLAVIKADSSTVIDVDLAALRVRFAGGEAKVDMPAGAREQLLQGTWNATAVMLQASGLIEQTAARLPYTWGF